MEAWVPAPDTSLAEVTRTGAAELGVLRELVVAEVRREGTVLRTAAFFFAGLFTGAAA